MSMGIFDGNLRFTVYRGTNLIQMDAIARPNEPSVAYKYDAGLKGFSTATMPRVDLARHRRRSAAASVRRTQSDEPVGHSRGKNRVLVAEGASAARSRRSRRRTRSSSRAKWT